MSTVRFVMTADAVTAVWNERQRHRVGHADFLAILRAIDAAPRPVVAEVIAVTGRKAYMVHATFAWLLGTGALTRAGKRAYAKSVGFRRQAARTWFACDHDHDDDLEAGAEDVLFA